MEDDMTAERRSPSLYVAAGADTAGIVGHCRRRAEGFSRYVHTPENNMTRVLCAAGAIARRQGDARVRVAHILEYGAGLKRSIPRRTIYDSLRRLLASGVLKRVKRGVVLVTHYKQCNPTRDDPEWIAEQHASRELRRLRNRRYQAKRKTQLVRDSHMQCADSSTITTKCESKTLHGFKPDANAPTKNTASMQHVTPPIVPARRLKKMPLAPTPEEIDRVESELCGLDPEVAASLERMRLKSAERLVATRPASPQAQVPTKSKAAGEGAARAPDGVPMERLRSLVQMHAHLVPPESINLLAVQRTGASFDTVRQGMDLLAEAVKQGKRRRPGPVRSPGAFLVGSIRNLPRWSAPPG